MADTDPVKSAGTVGAEHPSDDQSPPLPGAPIGEQVASLISEIAALRSGLSWLQEENGRLRADVVEMRRENADLTMRVARLERTNAIADEVRWAGSG